MIIRSGRYEYFRRPPKISKPLPNSLQITIFLPHSPYLAPSEECYFFFAQVLARTTMLITANSEAMIIDVVIMP